MQQLRNFRFSELVLQFFKIQPINILFKQPSSLMEYGSSSLFDEPF